MLRRSRSTPAGLEQLVAACEAGLDMQAILTTASAAVGSALCAATVGAYTLSEDGEAFVLAAGSGVEQLPADESTEPAIDGTTVRLPMVSARRVLGCFVSEGARAGNIATARVIAGVAAQAVEAARMWESGAAGSGTVDLLTGLPNHRGFSERSARELSRAKRTGSVVSVGIVDIDGFSVLNERPGPRRRRRPAANGGTVLRRRRALLRQRVPAGPRRVRSGAARNGVRRRPPH